ncbi:MAG TPA: hypothetical protein DCP31_06330 [Cyanobacteria bacterium UBA8543]|nr:hypothetical protein [Cyanobacteria bacterium UBA8543]
MSQNTSVESSTHTLPNPSINPVMQAALGSLDVELEEELARYRRQRVGRPVMSPRGLGRHQIRKPIELISVNKGRGRTQLPALGMSTAPVMSFPLTLGNQTPAEAAPSEETKQQPRERTSQLEAPSLADSEAVSPLIVSSTSKGGADKSASEHNFNHQLNSPDQSTDMAGELVRLEADQGQPEDYLESSEQLLRSLEEPEDSSHSQKRFADRLLTPLGVGSILLLLLSIPTVAYILSNPSTFNALNFGRFFGSKTQNTAQKPTQTTPTKRDPAKDSPIANGPNLASEEFVDLNLNTLSHLEANPQPSPPTSAVSPPSEVPNTGTTSTTAPTVVPNSALPKRSTDLASVLLSPSPQQRTVQPIPQVAPLPLAPPASVPRTSTPSRASAAKQLSSALAAPATKQLPVPPTKLAIKKPSQTPAKVATKKVPASSSAAQVAPSSAKSRDGFYYVLINGAGGRTLEKAKTIAPDAYVRNLPQGSRIQVAAFKRESEAKTLVTQLQQQGLSASVYTP